MKTERREQGKEGVRVQPAQLPADLGVRAAPRPAHVWAGPQPRPRLGSHRGKFAHSIPDSESQPGGQSHCSD